MTILLRWLAMLTAMTFGCCAAFGAGSANSQAHAAKITVLVTNLGGDPYEGDGEWGYSALVEVDGHKILYDTGLSADLVFEATFRLRESMGPSRKTAVVSAVGSSFTLGQGIDPRRLAQ